MGNARVNPNIENCLDFCLDFCKSLASNARVNPNTKKQQLLSNGNENLIEVLNYFRKRTM